MSAPAKFLFDLDFSGTGSQSAEQAASKAALEVAVAEAEARGYRNGYAAAQADTTAELERRKAAALERIGTAIASLSGSLGAVERRLDRVARDGVVVVREVALAPAAQFAVELVEAAVD